MNSVGWLESIKTKAESAGCYVGSDPSAILDLDRDADLIYEAIKDMGVDLEKEDISFKVFIALISNAPAESRLCRAIYLRSQSQAGKLTQSERKEFEAFNAERATTKDRQPHRQAP